MMSRNKQVIFLASAVSHLLRIRWLKHMPGMDPRPNGRALHCYRAKAWLQGGMRTGALMDLIYFRWMTEWLEAWTERGKKTGRQRGSSIHCVHHKGKGGIRRQFPKSLMLSGVSHCGAILAGDCPGHTGAGALS